MKKLVLSISVLALLASCGAEESQEQNAEENEKDTEQVEEIVEEETEEITYDEEDVALPVATEYTSFDFLMAYNKSGHKLLDALAGQDVTITDFLCVSVSDTRIKAIGFNGVNSTEFSDPDNGYKNTVHGDVLPAYSTDYMYVDLWNFTYETKDELKDYEQSEDGYEKTYHSSFSIVIPGDELKYFSTTALDLYNAKITEIHNF